MKEEYDGEKTIVKFTRAEIFQMGHGKIFNGHKVSVGMEVEK